MNKKASDEIIPVQLKQWGRIRIVGGGDLIHARGYHKLRPDGRDASFIRVSMCISLLSVLFTNISFDGPKVRTDG
jgi:hypothetical protein